MKKNINNMTSKKAYIRPEISSIHTVHCYPLLGSGGDAKSMSTSSVKDDETNAQGKSIWTYRVGW